MKIKKFYKSSQFILLVALMLVTGCKQTLYGNLDEVQANDMVYVLAKNGIYSEREVFEDKYSIVVDESKIPEAIRVLKSEGYPKRTFASLGSVFTDNNYINSSFQEYARYTHAVSEGLAESITNIPGVSEARVHIMLPKVSKISNKQQSEPTASVFIYTDEIIDVGPLTTVIKDMVTHAVENMEYENVAVAVFDINKSNNKSNNESIKLIDNDKSKFLIDKNNFSKGAYNINIFNKTFLAIISFIFGIFLFKKAIRQKVNKS